MYMTMSCNTKVRSKVSVCTIRSHGGDLWFNISHLMAIRAHLKFMFRNCCNCCPETALSIKKIAAFLAHLSQRLKFSNGNGPACIVILCPHFQSSISLKLVGQFRSNFL